MKLGITRTAVVLILGAALGVLLSGCATPTQIRLDQRLSALCAMDGGITINETVSLPPSAFDQNGFINFYNPTRGERTLGDAFIYKYVRQNLVPGSDDGDVARLSRLEVQVVRRADGKLLGQAVFYNRFGGDFANPGQPTSKTCPQYASENTLFRRLFVPGGGN